MFGLIDNLDSNELIHDVVCLVEDTHKKRVDTWAAEFKGIPP